MAVQVWKNWQQTWTAISRINHSMNSVRLVLAALLLFPGTAIAQRARPDVTAVEQAEHAQVQAPDDATQAVEPAPEPGGVRRFARDVGGDYKHFLSWSTAKWLGVGTVATAAILPADEAIRDATQPVEATLLSETAGQTYGNLSLQVPLAVVWWIAGHAAGSTRAAETGRDLVRAQISAASWTYVVKYSFNRTRPNGDPRGFPSGHASSAFATAMVLQEHYGWKLGVPVFAIASYTAASRVVDNRHWASDVVFGAFLGMASARTVTVRLRSESVSIAPLAVAGGGGVTVSMRMIP
jgi:membrane-associated phospholipid phosphatase